ncbi:MAG: four helix bundle protein [Gemmatimonadaceae bacterium]
MSRTHSETLMGDYRKMQVWQRSRVVHRRVKALVRTLPRNVQLGIGDQLERAAESIRLALVEGAGLNSDPQLAKYLSTALGSANEVQEALDMLDEDGQLPEGDRDLIPEMTEIRAMLASFHRRVSKRKRN